MPASSYKQVQVILLLIAATAIAASGQELSTLASFDGANGWLSESALVQATDGSLYGTTAWGGNLPCNGGNGCGTVFKITPADKFVTLYVFCAQPNCADGALPYAGLIQATDGNFYGTTFAGGTGGCDAGVVPGCGTIFKITPRGDLTTLHSVCSQPGCSDGGEPTETLIQGANGNFYGTTSTFGANGKFGTVFEITARGKLITLHSFDGSDGASPAATQPLVQSRDGDFYGTTAAGGTFDGGTVFKITPGGKLTTLSSFCAVAECSGGSQPLSGVIQANNGNFYGATASGGAHGEGTVFEVTPQGRLTTLYSFCAQQPNCADGAVPYAGVIQATDGNLYGATYSDGTHGLFGGTIFQINTEGWLTTLYDFCAQSDRCLDGAGPRAGLTQTTNGNFYGTTQGGGAFKDGTVFSLSMGFGPFVKTIPRSGKLGAEVGILGTNLTGATSVAFNGIPAQFSVRSGTLILAYVPSGASTGTIQVSLPARTLLSDVPFYVLP